MILDDLISNIDTILNRITIPKLNAYEYTQNQLHLVNVSTDKNYQRIFNGFYRVRLPKAEAYEKYYTLIEQNKNNSGLSLNTVLNTLFIASGRVETSFGSKLLATVNPNVAPLDSIVLGHLGLKLPAPSSSERIKECVKVHENLVECMNTLITLPKFEILKAQFQKEFPNYMFTDVKILDLLLWQYRN